LCMSQMRMKIGDVRGSPETTTGGNALKFSSSVRLDIRRIGAVKEGDQVIGSRTRVKVVKNKLAPPFREAEFDILYGIGISRPHELLDLACDRGLVEKNGAWFTLGGERIGPGREKAAETLKQNAELAGTLERGGGEGAAPQRSAAPAGEKAAA